MLTGPAFIAPMNRANRTRGDITAQSDARRVGSRAAAAPIFTFLKVLRLGVMQGEYHWHQHTDDDEFLTVENAGIIPTGN